VQPLVDERPILFDFAFLNSYRLADEELWNKSLLWAFSQKFYIGGNKKRIVVEMLRPL
jgi:hypothetical protein